LKTPKPRSQKHQFLTNCANCHRLGKLCPECQELQRNGRKKRMATILQKDYFAYIKTQDWKEKSDKAKKRAGYHCQICNAPEGDAKLNTHHRTYERLGNELPSDLIVLCEFCHTKFHSELNRSIRMYSGI